MADESGTIVHPKKAAFLAAYAQCPSIIKAARIADIGRQTHYDWLQSDPDYPAAFAAAHQEAVDRLEREARRRAIRGVKEPVYYKGEIVGYKRKYSDTMLAMLLNANLPEKYRRYEYGGNDQAPKSTPVTPEQQVLMMDDTIPQAEAG